MFSVADSPLLTLGDAGSTHNGHGLNLDVMSSVLIGLAAPMIIAMVVDPTQLNHARGIVVIVLTTIFFTSIILFAHSLLLPGDVRAVAFDPLARTATLVRHGLFASNDLDIPFGLIKSLRVEKTCNADGCEHRRALMVMTTRETIELPHGTTEAQLALIRWQTGLH